MSKVYVKTNEGFLKNTFDKFLNLYLIFLLVFTSHRYLSFFYLNRDQKLSSFGYLDSAMVGLFSDIWIAFLAALIGALVFAVLGIIFKHLTSGEVVRKTWLFVWVAFVVICASLHQGYVEFFKVQILPIHLKYFFDRHFLEANAGSAINPRAVLILLLGAGFCWLLLSARIVRSPKAAMKVFIIIALSAVAAHVLNIRWRVQHFIQDSLQVNFYEKLYLNSKVSKEPKKLSASEFDFLATRLKPNWMEDSGKDAEHRLLSWPSALTPMDPIAEKLRGRIAEVVESGEKPIILTVLLESARPSDFGAYGGGDTPSLTPVFDGLSKGGILFENAFSTGSVTRGGQEAVWCGYYSSMNNSMMRERQDIHIDCLPRLLGKEGEFFWYHGGRGEFDQQETFWKAQGVEALVTQRDFPEDTPKTDWGIGDIALAKFSLTKLKSLEQRSSKKYLMGMMLSMTNHIPWGLPTDALASPLFQQLQTLHPSYATTHYTDQSLGVLVEGLKEQGAWNRTILLILSDHGSSIPPYDDIYPDKTRLEEKLRSHIVMIVSGGVVESEITSGLRVSDFVSQAGIAGFLDFLVGGDHNFFAPSIFYQGLSPLVLADLEGEVFLPRANEKLSRQQALVGDASELGEDVRQEVYYYRVFLDYMNHFVDLP